MANSLRRDEQNDDSTEGDSQVLYNLRPILGGPGFHRNIHSSSAAVDNVIHSVGKYAHAITSVRSSWAEESAANTSLPARTGINEFADLPVELVSGSRQMYQVEP